MANEIYASLSFTARKGGAEVAFSKSFQLDMTADDMLNATQSIGFASAETVNLGDLAGAPSAIIIYNLDATNFIEIGGDSGLTVFKTKILPGSFQIFQPTSATIYAQADTAAVRIQVVATDI